MILLIISNTFFSTLCLFLSWKLLKYNKLVQRIENIINCNEFYKKLVETKIGIIEKQHSRHISETREDIEGLEHDIFELRTMINKRFHKKHNNNNKFSNKK